MKITVITVVYNAKNDLEKTILSVLSQTYPNIEYIIIDGGSTDGTLDIIKKYKSKITYWISEPDEGIYDAMNKGINLATGKWINFMNAGDIFFDKYVIERIFKQNIIGYHFIYGSHFKIYPKKILHFKCKPLNFLWETMCFCHQSLFVKTILMKKTLFNTTYKIVADHEFIFKHYIKNYTFFECNFPISIVSSGGSSDTQLIKRTIEKWNFILEYDNSSKISQNFTNELLKYQDIKSILIGAKGRIYEHLSYKLGNAMIKNSKSFTRIIAMPLILISIAIAHKEQQFMQENIRKKNLFKQPKLEDYNDYKEALKEKECLTYKLGEALIQANKTWYKGGYIKLLFEIRKLLKKFNII